MIDSTEPVPIPTLSAKDFDMLCDDLLSGEVSSPIPSLVVPPSGGISSTEKRPSRHTPNLGLAWMWACLLIGGGFLWSGLSGSASSSRPLIAASTSRLAPIVAGSSVAKYETKSIRDIQVGERVLAHNPELSDSERAAAVEPDQATWRHIQFLMHKPDGSDLQIEMLRPVEWLEEHAVSQIDLESSGWFVREHLLLDPLRWEEGLVGRTIELDLAELGATGPAKVLSITPCPSIEPDTGDGRQVVTATFKHSAGDVLDLSIAGEPKPIGTTANHPFWSEDRQAFIPAGQLQVGENLRHADNTITQVTRINPRRGPPVAVYNLEVKSEHVYFVGQDGVLVHNSCVHGNSLLSLRPQHGYAILDAVTGKILKFGVSGGAVTRSGESVRALRQVSALRRQGITAQSVIIEKFANRVDVMEWERQAVNGFRQFFVGDAHILPLNFRP